jgi:hypothetical protein
VFARYVVDWATKTLPAWIGDVVSRIEQMPTAEAKAMLQQLLTAVYVKKGEHGEIELEFDFRLDMTPGDDIPELAPTTSRATRYVSPVHNSADQYHVPSLTFSLVLRLGKSCHGPGAKRVPLCEVCGVQMRASGRDKKTCSDRCRAALSRRARSSPVTAP